MAAISTYLANKFLNHSLRNDAYTPPTTVYIALFTSITGLSTNAPSGTEVSGGSYARIAMDFDAAASGATQNVDADAFAAASGSWGTVTHWAIVDHASNTTWGTNVNVMYYGAFSSSFAPGTGGVVTIADGDLDLSIV